MSPGVWKGNDVPLSDRILILGESHYGDENSSRDYIGKKVPYKTSGVVNDYLSHKELGSGKARWDRFFDKIVESFGYTNCKEFFDKVYFGNYVPVLCEVGDLNPANKYITNNRIEYNDQLFKFVNSNNISIIICFSKAVFWKMPSSCPADRNSYREIDLPKISRRNNLINVYEYEPNVEHMNTNIVLNKPLLVYGVRHPSSRGGYDARAVYNAFSSEKRLQCIVK